MSTVQPKTTTYLRKPWASVSFIVEAILLLVFLVASLAVLTQLFSSSLNRSVQGRTLDAATIAATSIAEHFVADPNRVEERVQLGDLLVVCDTKDELRKDGVMHYADISVYDLGEHASMEPVYTLSTSCYESGAS